MSRQSPIRKYIHHRNHSVSNIDQRLTAPDFRRMFSAATRRTDLSIKQTPKGSIKSSPKSSPSDTTFGFCHGLSLAAENRLSDSIDSHDDSLRTRKQVVDKAISRYKLNLSASSEKGTETVCSPFSTLQLMQNINSNTTRQTSPPKDEDYSKHISSEEIYFKTISRLEDEVQHYKTLYEKLAQQYATDKKLWESEIAQLKSRNSKRKQGTERESEAVLALEKLRCQLGSSQDLVSKICKMMKETV
jgi:hypothetical protein